MNPELWKAFVDQYSREILAVEEVRECLPEEVIDAQWTGLPGATAAELAELERRLGVSLPPSYRSFLAISNGWYQPGWFIDQLLPTSNVAWFRDAHQDWIDAYTEPAKDSPRLTDEEYLIYGPDQSSVHFREEYLQSALQISAVGDGAVLLLNPAIQTPQGEWEAWSFANWKPGANRYPSFWELMTAERESFQRLAAKR